MAVADAVLPSPPPPPPPARTVVVRFALAPMLALGRVLRVAAGALPYLGLAAVWFTSAASAAKVVARRAWGEDSASFLFLQTLTYGAFTVLACVFLVLLALGVLLLCRMCVAYVIAAVRGSRREFKERAVGAIKPDSAADSFSLPRTAVLGFMADVPFMLLVVAGLLLAAMSHVEGSVSQGEMVGLVIVDVGIFAMNAISCSVIVPALALSFWKEDQADRKAPSQFC
ncbi:hypothetical protein TRIUR3_09605 [Triticum urartu]|uniref:Uncharacterized protein n=1 Tax=Triticum urartu TaxID=4572 RepID=M8AI23_TRIUA|nr:uncharacterized protein LOC119357636 [Triticum dicoccoides]XP_048554804.1 uncharacterized protein LOC125535773 [Triticum urartu]EMS60409.1 hypothetical protein TRIUR3_09605 [Triticum urartu]